VKGDKITTKEATKPVEMLDPIAEASTKVDFEERELACEPGETFANNRQKMSQPSEKQSYVSKIDQKQQACETLPLSS
jgi:hypothetical protein